MTHGRRYYLVLYADGGRRWKEAKDIGDGALNEYKQHNTAITAGTDRPWQ